MSKLMREYESGLEKRTLVFRGKELSYTMRPSELGTEGDAPCFTAQLNDSFPDLSQDLLDEVDMLDCETDEDEIFNMLEMLNEVE